MKHGGFDSRREDGDGRDSEVKKSGLVHRLVGCITTSWFRIPSRGGDPGYVVAGRDPHLPFEKVR